MSKHSTIIGLGILVALMPFLGFPLIVKDIFFVIIGLTVAVIAYFSNIQYCNNCNQLVENGKHGISSSNRGIQTGSQSEGSKQPVAGGELLNPSEQRRPLVRERRQSRKDNIGMST